MELSLQRRLRVFALLTLAAPIIAAAFGVSTLLAPKTATAAQTIPYKVNFQGRLTDNAGNILSDGLYNIKFRFWDALTSGTNKFEEDRIITGTDNRVQVTNGLFNIQFGDVTVLSPTLFSGAFPLYLEVELPTPATANCATNGCAVFTEGPMTPRQALASSAYAFNADTVDGIDGASLVQLSPAGAQTGNININGTISSTGTVNGANLTGGSLSASSVNGLNVSANAIAVATAATHLTVDAGTTGAVEIGGVSTGDILIGGGVASTGCTVTNTSGNLACAGTITGTTVTGTTGINTGSAGGTQRIDTSGNLVNIANITQSGSYLLQNTTNSTTAFSILTAGGTPRTVVNVDTTNTAVSLDSNLIVSSSVALPSITSISFSSNSSGSLSGATGTTYFYRVSAIVGTETAASGETWISSSSFTPLSAPSAPTASSGASGGISGTYIYKYTYVTANGETIPSTASGSVSVSNKKINVTIATGPTGTTARKIYRTTNGGTTYLLLTTIADNVTTAYVDSTADAGLGVAAPGTNSATTNLNSVTVTFPSFPSATSYRIYRGLSSRSEDHYQTTSASPFTDTGTTGTAATPINPSSGRVGVGLTNPGYALDVTGNISASNAFIQSGNVGQSTSCGAGSTFSGVIVSGGIVTSIGSCASIGGGSASATLQSAYDNSTSPQIVLTTAGGALTVRDSAAGLGSNLLAVQNNAGTTDYFDVTATGLITSGNINVGAGITIGSGQVVTVGATPGVAKTCTGSQYLDGIVTLGGIVTAGTCTTLSGGGGANTTLSNLGATAVNADLIPDATANNRNIGSVSVLWGNGYYGTSVQSPLFTGPGAVSLKSTTSSNLTIDSGTTGSILIGGDTVNAKTITIGPAATNTSSTAIQIGVNISGAQNLDLGSTGSGDAAAGTAINIQGGTTPNTAITLGTNGAGGITIDTGTTGSILIGNGASAKSSTLGSTNTTSTTNILGGTTGSINIGSVGASTLSSTLNIATSTSATGTQIVTIGSNANAANSVSIDAGNTGAIAIGDTTSAHTINIATSGAAGGNAQIITIGSGTTTTASLVTLQGGNITTTNGNSGVIVGSGYGADTNLVVFTLDSSSTFAETANTCTASVNGGSLYYNSAASSGTQGGSNAIRACIGGSWEDIVSTAGLGIMLFGVVPDSGNNPGDLASTVTTGVTGPCKVSWASATSVTVAPCTAYSGGRKVIVSSTTLTTVNGTTNNYQHVCLTGTNSAPALSTSATEAVGLPAFSVNNPVLCLADINFAGTNNTISRIFDVRTFTNSTKEFVSSVAALGLGWPACPSAKQATTCAAAVNDSVMGVVAASSGAVGAGGVPNVILVTSGPTLAKPNLTLVVAGDVVGSVATANRLTATILPTGTLGTAFDSNLGISRSASPGTACTTTANAANCDYQLFFNQQKR